MYKRPLNLKFRAFVDKPYITYELQTVSLRDVFEPFLLLSYKTFFLEVRLFDFFLL